MFKNRKNYINQNYIGLTLTVIFTVYYNLLFYNKYFPITEGWFSSYSNLINMGYIPYEDFFLFLMPLYPYQLALFQEIFGYKIIYLRIFGVVIMTLFAVFLYLILNRRFNAISSMFATTSSIVFYCSGVAFINYDFTQVMTLYAIISVYFILKAEDYINCKKSYLYLFFAGLFLSLTFLIKQSNGLFIALFCTIAVLIIFIRRKILLSQKNKLLIFILGAIIPLTVTLIWLLKNDLSIFFIDQVIFGSIKSKGTGIYEIIFSWIKRLDLNLIYERFKLFTILTLYIISIYLICNKNNDFTLVKNDIKTSIFIIPFFLILIIATHLIYKENLNLKYLNLIRSIFLTNINNDLLIVPLLGFSILIILTSLNKNSIIKDFLIFFIISFGFIFGNGTSAGLSEISLFLILAFSIAYLSSLKPMFIFLNISFLFSLLIICTYSSLKFNQPYAWWYVDEPSIKSERKNSSQELLSGMRISLKSQKTIDDIVTTIINNSNHDDDIFVFPNISGLYFLSDRWPKSKVIVSWFDFLPDNLAISEALRIKNNPPVLIVNLTLPEEAWKLHEEYFRKGHPLGQREIYLVIKELTNSKNYSNIYTTKLVDGVNIEVWKKIK